MTASEFFYKFSYFIEFIPSVILQLFIVGLNRVQEEKDRVFNWILLTMPHEFILTTNNLITTINLNGTCNFFLVYVGSVK